ncbi:fimbria/pilus periplasmic chaperone [Microbulbifer sp. PSTR4-B]|uniref:fimbria/pilus periplasmic chaperone n=1 Tax=Microbulbifer sp. PSTR4-B TaxID=3243396 RepID=UPI0040398D85
MKKILLSFLLLLGQPALAAMSLDKIIFYLDDAPNARDDVVITNPDKETLYVQTEIFRVDNPGLDNEERIRVINPDEFRLLVSPAKAILAPGERKRFRLMALDRDLKEEKVYRVTFKPVVGEVKSEQTALKILVAYQALVFVQPEDGSYQLELQADGSQRYLKNIGNINVEVVEARHCPSEGECQKLDISGRLYSGTSLTLEDLPTEGELELFLRGRDSERVRLPLGS